MTLKIRTGGAWHDAPVLASGGVALTNQPVGLRCRSGAQWQHAQRVAIKTGGVWTDSGYVGPPWIPQSPAGNGQPVVTYWDYATLRFGWWGPAGGPPVSAYHWVLTNEGGGWLAQGEVAGGETPNLGVSQDTKYQCYVRTKNTKGDYSTWLGPLKVWIGHAQEQGWVTVTRTTAYHAETTVNLWENIVQGVTVPSNVAVNSMSWNFSATNGAWGYCSETPNPFNGYNWRKQIRPIRNNYWNSSDGSETMTIPNPGSGSNGYGGQNGGGGLWGFIALGNNSDGGGQGFASAGTGFVGGPNTVVGGMSVDGTQTFSDSQWLVTRTEQGNQYW